MWAAFSGEVRPLILLWGEIGYCEFPDQDHTTSGVRQPVVAL